MQARRCVRRQGADRDANQQRPGGADPGGFVGGEKAGIDAADDDDEQNNRPDDPEQRLEPLPPCGSFGLRPQLGPPPDDVAHRPYVEEHAEQPGQKSGGEEIADRGFGQKPVDHQDHARRDQDAEGSAGGDRGGR